MPRAHAWGMWLWRAGLFVPLLYGGCGVCSRMRVHMGHAGVEGQLVDRGLYMPPTRLYAQGTAA